MKIISRILVKFTDRMSKSYVSPLSWRNPERGRYRKKVKAEDYLFLNTSILLPQLARFVFKLTECAANSIWWNLQLRFRILIMDLVR